MKKHFKSFWKKRKIEVIGMAAGETAIAIVNTIINYRNGAKLTKDLLKLLGRNAVFNMVGFHVLDWVLDGIFVDDEDDEEE